MCSLVLASIPTIPTLNDNTSALSRKQLPTASNLSLSSIIRHSSNGLSAISQFFTNFAKTLLPSFLGLTVLSSSNFFTTYQASDIYFE